MTKFERLQDQSPGSVIQQCKASLRAWPFSLTLYSIQAELGRCATDSMVMWTGTFGFNVIRGSGRMVGPSTNRRRTFEATVAKTNRPSNSANDSPRHRRPPPPNGK